MKISVLKGLLIAIIASISLSSCLTSTYYGPGGFVNYELVGTPKKSEQSSKIFGSTGLVGSYDDEYIYDDKGNVIKYKQTEYLDRMSSVKKFNVWETEYKLVGGIVVPVSVSVNGVSFTEVEYEILPVKRTGPIVQDTKDRRYVEILDGFLMGQSFMSWSISHFAYPVSFKPDGKFVNMVSRYDVYNGDYKENILTLGYDNIVLKKFSYSQEKLTNGLIKSGFYSSYLGKFYKDQSAQFSYSWKVIGEKICQTELAFKAQQLKFTTLFNATQKYDAAGNRVEEVWTVTDPRKEKNSTTEIFRQTQTF